jgi:hypothetical protein
VLFGLRELAMTLAACNLPVNAKWYGFETSGIQNSRMDEMETRFDLVFLFRNAGPFTALFREMMSGRSNLISIMLPDSRQRLKIIIKKIHPMIGRIGK